MSAPEIPRILTPSTVAFHCGLTDMCVYMCVNLCVCVYMGAIFIITHSAQSLLRRHSGLSDRAFTPSNSYGAASARRDIYLNGSKTSPSLVPAELNINGEKRNFMAHQTWHWLNRGLLRYYMRGTCANSSYRQRKMNRFVQFLWLHSSKRLILLLHEKNNFFLSI